MPGTRANASAISGNSRRRRDRKRQRARNWRTPGGLVGRNMPSKRSSQSVRGPRRLRSVRKAGELRGRPQRRLHQLVAIGRPANHPDGEERSDNALHLSGVPRHRRRRASGRGRPVAITRRAILERLVLERNWLAEILAKRDTRADPCPIQGGASRPAAAAGADLHGAVKFIQQAREWPKIWRTLRWWPWSRS